MAENNRETVLRNIEEKAKKAMPSAKNPHPAGTQEASAWERGHSNCNLITD